MWGSHKCHMLPVEVRATCGLISAGFCEKRKKNVYYSAKRIAK